MIASIEIDDRPTMSDETYDDIVSDIEVSRSGKLSGLTVIIKSRFEREFYHLPVTSIEDAAERYTAGVVDLGLRFGDMDVQAGMVVRDGVVLACVADGIRRYPTPTMISAVGRLGRAALVPCAATDVRL